MSASFAFCQCGMEGMARDMFPSCYNVYID